jgi:hypothetical protein
MRVQPGHPYPLGATWHGLGVNFALSSESAWFEPNGREMTGPAWEADFTRSLMASTRAGARPAAEEQP